MSAAIGQAIGWGVVQSLWQGAAAAGAVGLVLVATRSARARYAAACLALLGMVGSFAATVWISVPEPAQRIVIVPPPFRSIPAGGGSPMPWRPNPVSAAMPWIGAFWAAGVLVFQLRAAANWNAARRFRIRGVCAPPAPWLDRLIALRARLRISRPVLLLESSLAHAPAVVGYLRPAILLPAGILSGMPAAQVEAILLHELAHIRRRDYLANVLQSVAEAVLFYHPAAWWISRVIRAEREHCCDDLAVAAVGNAREYGAALAALEETRWSAEPAVAATGGSLMKRIRRLLKQPEGPRVGFAPVLGASIIAIAAGVALFGWQPRPPQQADSPQESPKPYKKWLQEDAANITLPTPYRKWVREDVAYIIDDRERATFLSLTTDEEREKFIEQFWVRRDPTPGTPANEYKEEHYRRIAYANERFFDSKVPGWKTDRGRIYIVFGPPDEIESHPSGDPTGTAYPYEEWLYRSIPRVGQNVIVRFEDPNRTGEFRQTSDPRLFKR